MKLATLCYVDNGSQYLLLHRNKKEKDVHAGKWIGLGGKLELGETPEECVKREILEESGLSIEHPELRGIITFPNFDGDNDWYVFLFVAKQFSGQLIESNEGSLQWVHYDEILSMPTWEGDLIFLKWLLENKSFFSAKMVYENSKLLHNHVIFYEK